VCGEGLGDGVRVPEEVVGVISGSVEVLGSGLVMGQFDGRQEQIRNRHHLQRERDRQADRQTDRQGLDSTEKGH